MGLRTSRWLLLWLLGCSTEGGVAGEPCQRSSQCDPGLACIEQTCSGDLSALSEQSQVPDLAPDLGDAGRDAGSDAGQDGGPADDGDGG